MSYGLPWWLSGKEYTCNAWNAGVMGSIPGSGRCPGEGRGSPLQYSCWENPKDRAASWDAVQRVTKSQIWLSHWAHMHTMAYDWWLHIFGGWKSSSELGMGYYWNFTMEVKMDFLKYSNHPVGTGYPLQVEFWCWRINFEIISKIRNHLDSGYHHRSIKKCHSIQPPSPNPQFNEFVSKIHDCIKHTCIKHQWFPFGVEAYYWGKDSFIHITNYTTPYILPFCKSLYLKFDKVAH